MSTVFADRQLGRPDHAPDRPYLQVHDERVLLLAGAARIAMAGAEVALAPGDALLIQGGREHRVNFSDPAGPTGRLAVHIGKSKS